MNKIKINKEDKEYMWNVEGVDIEKKINKILEEDGTYGFTISEIENNVHRNTILEKLNSKTINKNYYNDIPIDIKKYINEQIIRGKIPITFGADVIDAELGHRVSIYIYDIQNMMKDEDYENPELKYYTYGFECSDIEKINIKQEKDNIYNKLLNQFESQLKEWIYNEQINLG